MSTTFSGVIQDGGQAGGIGGSLTKIGLGTLALTGPNTYTGRTTIPAVAFWKSMAQLQATRSSNPAARSRAPEIFLELSTVVEPSAPVPFLAP